MTTKIPGGLITVALLLASASAQTGDDWPREYTSEDGKALVIYPPQVDAWEDFRILDAHAAISFRMRRESKPMLGAVRLRMNTVVDRQKRRVSIRNVRVTESMFPSFGRALTRSIEPELKRVVPTAFPAVPLDLLLAGMDLEPVSAKEEPLSVDPPELIVSRRDALLIVLDGDPVFEPIEGTELEVVVNTASTLLRHRATRRYFLLDNRHWLEAPALPGPWQAASVLPADFQRLPDSPRLKTIRAHVPGKPHRGDTLPEVHVRTSPAELIVTHGEPRFRPVARTGLLYVINTEADVFLDSSDGLYYVLLSGRWYRSNGKDDPITYAGDDLPDAFWKIPSSHVCGRVLSSVPGTRLADESMIVSRIPERARAYRDRMQVDVSYVGEPEFVRIEGTEVERAVNTCFDVLRVAGRCYACIQGVWFVGATPRGPWSVADDVPPGIYTIPPTSPSYPVTYVVVVGSDAGWVDFEYWPGYLGTYDHEGTLVHGTGYRWRHDPRYYRHAWRHWRHESRDCGGFDPTWGTGAYYDHLSGRFRRSWSARRHQTRRRFRGGIYDTWPEEAVRQNPLNLERSEGPRRGDVRGRAVATSRDLYASKAGDVYRRSPDGSWERYQGEEWIPVRLDEDVARAAARQKAKVEAAAEARRARARERAEARKTARREAEKRRAEALERKREARRELKKAAEARQAARKRSRYYRSYRRGRGWRWNGWHLRRVLVPLPHGGMGGLGGFGGLGGIGW